MSAKANEDKACMRARENAKSEIARRTRQTGVRTEIDKGSLFFGACNNACFLNRQGRSKG
jgi:hypothetical protein